MHRVRTGMRSAMMLWVIVASAVAGERTVLSHPHDLHPQETTAAVWNRFGSAVTLDGNTLLVGRPGDGHPLATPESRNTGSVVVYQWQGDAWQPGAVLRPAQAAQKQFGSTVAMRGDLAMVGAINEAHVFRRAGGQWQSEGVLPHQSGGLNAVTAVAVDSTRIAAGFAGDAARGAVHIYAHAGNQWQLEQRIEAPTPQLLGRFGCAVAMNQTHLLVGACAMDVDTEGFPGTGVVYTYVRGQNGWVHQGRIQPPAGAADDEFGNALQVTEDVLVVGAHRAGASEAGSAFVYAYAAGQWVLRQSVSRDGSLRLGRSLAMDADTLVIGSHGSAQVHARAGDTLLPATALDLALPPDAQTTQLPGTSVALSGDLLAIGGSDLGADAHTPGRVRTYRRIGGEWQFLADLREPQSMQDTGYGSVVAIDGDTALVAMPRSGPTPESTTRGAVQVLQRTGGEWRVQAYLQTQDGSTRPFGLGECLAVAADVAVVCSAYAQGGAARTPVHLYQRVGTQWLQVGNLARPGREQVQVNAVAMTSGIIALGLARATVEGQAEAGAVVIYTRDAEGNWGAAQELLPLQPVEYGEFGRRVAVHGDTLAVLVRTDGQSSDGFVEFYRRNGNQWVFLQRIAGTAESPFGGAISLLDDGTAFIGTGARTVLRLARSGDAWSLAETLTPPAGAGDRRIGARLAAVGDHLLVGAPLLDGVGNTGDQGSAVFRYRRVGGAWTLTDSLYPGATAGPRDLGVALAQSTDTALLGIPTADSVRTGSQNTGEAWLLSGDPPYAVPRLYADGFEAP